MAFQLPTTTTPGGTPAFSFGLNPPSTTTNAGAAAAPKPTFSFVAPAAATNLALAGGGDADNAKVAPPAQFGFASPATSTAPAMPAPLTGISAGVVAPTPKTAPPTEAPQTFGGFMAASAPTAVVTTTATASATVTGTPSVQSLGLATAPKSTANVAPIAQAHAQQTTAVTVAPFAATTAGGGGGTGSAFANLSTATKTTDSAAVANVSQMTYHQLEEHINKWTLEFEEQEKVFTEQATQINAWDKLLISNNLKILELNDAVQKVKSDQQVLDQELEFIATQHKELEESLAPLEKEFINLPRVDMERSQTYLMVENLDTQVKQMSEDLKEIIDNLNEANKGQDYTDPIIQIGKILNAHMNSLQWIDSQSSNICKKLDDIGKMKDTQKRDAFRSAF